jgi:endonuclease/exonuclease/phosphatase family metal-dependent hydrolase
MVSQKKVNICSPRILPSEIHVVLAFFVCFALLPSLANGEEFSFRVATLNAEWLWTPHDGRVDGARFNKGDPSESAYTQELRFYAGLLHQYDVDVLALSEIENEQVAEEFAAQLGGEWVASFRQGRDTATGQDVAILSKLGKPVLITDFGFPSGMVEGYKPKRLSKVLGIILEVDARKVGFVTAHLLSKRNDSPNKSAKRMMQAHAIVKAHNSFENVDAVVLLGDFNDYRSSPVLKTLEKETQTSNVLTACERYDITENRRYMIDHILFKGVRCKQAFTLDMQSFSDHPMLVAEFKF